jgi:hypothetical protein
MAGVDVEYYITEFEVLSDLEKSVTLLWRWREFFSALSDKEGVELLEGLGFHAVWL